MAWIEFDGLCFKTSMLSVELAHLGLLNYIPSMSPNGLELVPLIVHTKNNVTRTNTDMFTVHSKV